MRDVDYLAPVSVIIFTIFIYCNTSPTQAFKCKETRLNNRHFEQTTSKNNIACM